jgi:hypothetical protein
MTTRSSFPFVCAQYLQSNSQADLNEDCEQRGRRGRKSIGMCLFRGIEKG